MGAAAIPIAGAVVGGAMGYMGRDKNKNINTSSSNSGSSQGTWTPHPDLLPGYGFLGENALHLMQQPVPYFPGRTSAGPSKATQAGIEMGMGSLPWYNQGAEGLGKAGGMFGDAAQFGRQGMDLFGGAANMYGNAGNMAPGVANAYGLAQGMGQGVAGQYSRAGNAYYGAMPGQRGVLDTALGNYGFLSKAADVANNPYVQGQADAMKRTVNQNFKENLLPTINGGANQVNALGSSRHGVAQAQGAERTAEQLSRGLADLYGNAYGQGLGAQQNALGQLGNMQQGFTTIGDTAAKAAAMGRQGMQTMGEAAGYGERGMNAMGQGADYLSRGGQQYGLGMDQLGRSAGLQREGGRAYGEAGDIINRGAQAALGYGQGIEGYQQREIDDAMRRYAYQYQEPYTRMNNLMQILGFMQPMGTQYGSSVGNGMGMMPNPNFQSPFQAILGGALGGAQLGGMFSDRRLKRNIRRVGATPAGYHWYNFEYVWGEPGEGVMSDEVPTAWVIKHPSGYDVVDYGRVR